MAKKPAAKARKKKSAKASLRKRNTRAAHKPKSVDLAAGLFCIELNGLTLDEANEFTSLTDCALTFETCEAAQQKLDALVDQYPPKDGVENHFSSAEVVPAKKFFGTSYAVRDGKISSHLALKFNCVTLRQALAQRRCNLAEAVAETRGDLKDLDAEYKQNRKEGLARLKAEEKDLAAHDKLAKKAR